MTIMIILKILLLNYISQKKITQFSRPSVQEPAIHHISQQAVKMELDELPTTEETTKSIKQLKYGKAADDGIPPEIWKHG